MSNSTLFPVLSPIHKGKVLGTRLAENCKSSFSSPEPPGPLKRERLGTKAPPAKRDRRLWGRECISHTQFTFVCCQYLDITFTVINERTVINCTFAFLCAISFKAFLTSARKRARGIDAVSVLVAARSLLTFIFV